jgi:P27 family predicted phage terminase small subunit
MAGRPPKPTALKRLQGTLRAHRPQGVELPPMEMAECPEHIVKEARKQWHRIVGELVRHKIVATVDASVLELYCTAYANWKQAQAEWDEQGSTVEGKFGPVKNPVVQICQDERKEVMRLGSLLGLDPSGRVRLKVVKPEDEDDDDDDQLPPVIEPTT